MENDKMTREQLEKAINAWKDQRPEIVRKKQEEQEKQKMNKNEKN